MAPPLGKRLRRAVRSAIVRAFIRLIGLLPLGPALWLGEIIGSLAFRLAGRTRRLALEHLAMAFPGRTDAEREAIARGMFVHLAMCAMEVVTIRSYDRDLERHVSFARPDHLREVMARGKGMVYVTGHVGNWEIMARRVGTSGVPNAVIAKAGSDPKLNAMIERFRASGGVTTLWREDPDTGRAIIRTFRRGRALGILIDQDTNVQGVFAPFFGRPAWTPRAAADFALRFGAPVVVGTTHRRGPGRGDGHVIDTVEVSYDPEPADREAEVVRLTAACNAALEAAIRRHPEEWVWMHERWKTRPGERPEANPVPKTADLSNA